MRHGVLYQLLILQQPFNALADVGFLQGKQLRCSGNQLVLRQEAVTGVHVIMQLEDHAGFDPPGIIPTNAQSNGKLIHGAKGGFQAVFHQQVRIVI